MRVIPADDPLVGIILVFDFVDVLPGILRKSNVGTGLSGVDAGNTGFNLQSPVLLATDKHSAHLRLALRPRVLTYATENVTVDDQHGSLDLHFRLGRQDFRLSTASEASTSGSSPAIKYPISRPCDRAVNT